MNIAENISAIIYLKNKVNKWRNIAVLLAIFLFILVFKVMLGIGSSEDLMDGEYIASIKIEGVIFEDDYRTKILTKISEQDSIHGVILTINSPGGGIVGSEILYNQIRKISKKKPVVVVMESLAASGAYMTAIAADYIIAHNGTITGSIGVLLESPEFTELANKLGVKINTFKSSPLKASPSMFEKNNPQVDRVIKESIFDSYNFFVELVKERRGKKIKKEYEKIVFDGRVFTGRQAFRAGLVDKVGSIDDALEYLKLRKIDLKKFPIYEIDLLKKDDSFFNKFLGLASMFFENVRSSKNHNRIMAITPEN